MPKLLFNNKLFPSYMLSIVHMKNKSFTVMT